MVNDPESVAQVVNHNRAGFDRAMGFQMLRVSPDEVENWAAKRARDQSIVAYCT